MRNVKTWGILFLCLLLLPGVAYAQKRQIEGTVISQEDKEPLIGATVIVKGSLSGAETDLDGHFTLEVDPDAKFIIVDYIGMKQTQVPIPKNGILNVALQPEAMNLDEVVVTGYGNFSRSSFTGSANTLRADLLKEMPVVSIEQKLQGMTSGVNITGSSGQPGARQPPVLPESGAAGDHRPDHHRSGADLSGALCPAAGGGGGDAGLHHVVSAGTGPLCHLLHRVV